MKPSPSILFLVVCAAISAFACGNDGDNTQATVEISGVSKAEPGNVGNDNAGQGRTDAGVEMLVDAMVVDTDVGFEDTDMMNEADMLLDPEEVDAGDDANNLDIAPDAEIPVPTISDLELAEWGTFCGRLVGLPGALEISDEDLQYGYCVAQYNEDVDDYFAIEPADCGVSIFDCIDSIEDEYLTDFSLCDDLTAVPDNCDVEPLVIESCIANLLETQQIMGTQDVCAPTLENISAFRVTADRYQAAQSCLQELTVSCPSL